MKVLIHWFFFYLLYHFPPFFFFYFSSSNYIYNFTSNITSRNEERFEKQSFCILICFSFYLRMNNNRDFIWRCDVMFVCFSIDKSTKKGKKKVKSQILSMCRGWLNTTIVRLKWKEFPYYIMIERLSPSSKVNFIDSFLYWIQFKMLCCYWLLWCWKLYLIIVWHLRSLDMVLYEWKFTIFITLILIEIQIFKNFHENFHKFSNVFKPQRSFLFFNVFIIWIEIMKNFIQKKKKSFPWIEDGKCFSIVFSPLLFFSQWTEQHKFLWISEFQFQFSNATNREKNSNNKKFTFFTLCHKINYYQISSRFSTLFHWLSGDGEHQRSQQKS